MHFTLAFGTMFSRHGIRPGNARQACAPGVPCKLNIVLSAHGLRMESTIEAYSRITLLLPETRLFPVQASYWKEAPQMSALDPTVRPSRWYVPVTDLPCNLLTDAGILCGLHAVAVEHDPHTGYTGVNRCLLHQPRQQIHEKG